MADEITASDIAEAALNPQSATADGVSATAHSIPDIIAAGNYSAAKTALEGVNPNGGPKSAWAFTRTARSRPCGAVQ